MAGVRLWDPLRGLQVLVFVLVKWVWCKALDCWALTFLPSPQMPVCSYFLKGICSNSNCPYSHVYVSRKAEVCGDFLKGYCPLGAKVRGLQVGMGQVVKQSSVLSALTSVVLYSPEVVIVILSISQMTQRCSYLPRIPQGQVAFQVLMQGQQGINSRTCPKYGRDIVTETAKPGDTAVS